MTMEDKEHTVKVVFRITAESHTAAKACVADWLNDMTGSVDNFPEGVNSAEVSNEHRKRSGMSRARAYRVRDELTASVDAVYARMREHNNALQHLAYLELSKLLTDIRCSKEWIKAPAHVITFMKGYMLCAYRAHIREYPDCTPPK